MRYKKKYKVSLEYKLQDQPTYEKKLQLKFRKYGSHSIHNLLLLTSFLLMVGLLLGRQTMLTPRTGPADLRAHCAREWWKDGPTNGSPTLLSTGRHCARWGFVGLLWRSEGQHSPPPPPLTPGALPPPY